MINKSEREARQDKLVALNALGVNPYPNETPPHHTISRAGRCKPGTKVALVGRISAIRTHGKSTFLDLVEDEQKLQIYCKQDVVGDVSYEIVGLLDVGDYLWAAGELFITKAGEPSLQVSE